jgi:hypothetical protein
LCFLPPAIEEVQLKQRSIPDAIAIVASQETKEQKHSLSNSLSSKKARKRRELTLSFKLSIQRVQVKEEEKQRLFNHTSG